MVWFEFVKIHCAPQSGLSNCLSFLAMLPTKMEAWYRRHGDLLRSAVGACRLPQRTLLFGSDCSGIGMPEFSLKALGLNHNVLFASELEE